MAFNRRNEITSKESTGINPELEIVIIRRNKTLRR